MLDRWFELVGIVSKVVYNSDGHALVWQYNSKGVYTTQSFYAVINFRGVTPVYIPCTPPSVWKIKTPQKCRCFFGFYQTTSL
jgi:hypothetical protein